MLHHYTYKLQHAAAKGINHSEMFQFAWNLAEFCPQKCSNRQTPSPSPTHTLADVRSLSCWVMFAFESLHSSSMFLSMTVQSAIYGLGGVASVADVSAGKGSDRE